MGNEVEEAIETLQEFMSKSMNSDLTEAINKLIIAFREVKEGGERK